MTTALSLPKTVRSVAFLEIENLYHFDGLEITIKDFCGITMKDEKWMGYSGNFLSTTGYLETARYLSTYSIDNPSIVASRSLDRIIVDEAVFQKLFHEFDKVFRSKNMIHTIAKLTKSLSEFKIASYDTSLVISWFIIESLANIKKDQITTVHRDTRISTTLKILKDNGLLSLDLSTGQKTQNVNKLRLTSIEIE